MPKKNGLQYQDNANLDEYTAKLEQSFQNNTLFMEQVLNLEIQELVEGLEELPYEDDDNFLSDNAL